MRQRVFLAGRDDAGHARAVVRSVYAGTAADHVPLHNPEEIVGYELRNYLKAIYLGRVGQAHAIGSLNGWAKAIACVSFRCDAEISLGSVARRAAEIGISLPEAFVRQAAFEAAAAKTAGVPLNDPVILGEMLQLTAAEREEYHISRLIEACDETPNERINRQRRARRGSRPRVSSITATKPWLADGYTSRRTWERNGKRPKMSQTWSSIYSSNKEEGCSTKLATDSRARPNLRQTEDRKMSEQLDLLAWTPAPAPATILAFPQSRNRTRIRHVVDLLMKRRSQQSVQRCYDRELHRLAESLRISGLSAAQVDQELDGFTNAVNLELWRRESRRLPGGAA